MRLTEMPNAALVRMYAQNIMYGSPAVTGKRGTIVSVPHNGANIAIQAKPIASVAEYKKWFWSRNRWYDGGKMSPERVRRVVIMRRQGSSWKECGEAVGVAGGTAKSWVEFLPFHLAV